MAAMRHEADIGSAPKMRHSQSEREGLSTRFRAAVVAYGAMIPS